MSVIKRNDSTERILFERKKIDITATDDKITVLILLIAIIGSAIAAALCIEFLELPTLDLSLFATMPLVVLGAFHLIRSKYRFYLIFVAVAVGVMFYFGVNYIIIMTVAMISVGIAGVVQLVAVLQRFLFYRVVSSIEYLNVRDKLSLWDKAVAFLFNISGDLDTRNLEIDENVKRASLPWNEIWSSMKVSFLIGVFIWIYISMNPSWMEFESLNNVPAYLFAVMMYIPIIVLPFSIFMSLNVRIETRYRDFLVYDGIKGTVMRMAMPVFAAFMYIVVAMNKNGFTEVLGFIAISVVFNFFICMIACIIYYKGFESDIVDSVLSKWREFRPVQLMMSVKDPDKVMKEEVPDTPRRDYSDFGELVFPD